MDIGVTFRATNAILSMDTTSMIFHLVSMAQRTVHRLNFNIPGKMCVKICYLNMTARAGIFPMD